MQFTGTQLSIKRNFFAQTGNMGFGISCLVDNTTGRYTFGLSGTTNTGVLEFRLESGHVHYQGQFVHAYQANQEFLIEGQFTSGTANVVKDGAALVYGKPKATGAFDYFYFTRANAGMGATFDLMVSGDDTPVYNITQQGYLSSTGQNAVTGWFLNQSAWPVRVFDSEILATQNYSFGHLSANLAAGASGAFALTGDFNSLDFSAPILTTFHTNFDDVSILFSIIDVRSLNRFVSLTGPTDLSFNSTGVVSRTLSWLNYSGGFVTTAFNADISFGLTYSSGASTFTGVWDLKTGVDATTLVSLKVPGGFNSVGISGSGLFAPNSQVAFLVSHQFQTGRQDAAQLVISGREVINPINSLLVN